MAQDRRQLIIDALKGKGVDRGCPRCGHLHFSVVAETLIPIQSDPDAVGTGDLSSVPAVIVACSNCGFLTQHALGALGLFPEEVARAG